MTTIAEAKNLRNKINVRATVKSVGQSRNVNLKTGGTTYITPVEIEDESGSMNLNLWGTEADRVKTGSTVEIIGGYTTTFKGITSLSVGKYGTLNVA